MKLRIPYLLLVFLGIFASAISLYAYYGLSLPLVEKYPDSPKIYANHISFAVFNNDSLSKVGSSVEKLSVHVSMAVYENDSVADFEVERLFFEDENETFEAFEVNLTRDSVPRLVDCNNFIRDTALYVEKWDTLNQPLFWRKIMSMNNDSSLVNLGSSRAVVAKIATRDWKNRSEMAKTRFRDSLKSILRLPDSEHIYITSGKKYYYNFEEALPLISRGIDIFNSYGTDPWFAQAILLIESPGKSRTSPVGASGCFQLMPEVAMELGLVVNDSIDEREDFDKSAVAAADFIADRCVPQTRKILRRHNLPFSEDEIWFRLLALHVYHAGPRNVGGAINKIAPEKGGMELIKKLWQTEHEGFKNASQNYSQLALASMIQFDHLLASNLKNYCMGLENLLAENELGE